MKSILSKNKYLNPRYFIWNFALILVLSSLSGFLYAKGYLNNLASAAEETVTVNYSVSTNNDIMNQDGNQIARGSSYMWIGTAKNATQSYLGIRFNGTIIPKGAEIMAAEIKYTSATKQWISMSTALYAENNSAPQTFSTANTPSKRSLLPTVKSISDNVSWLKDQTYAYDVSDVVREAYKQNGINGSISLIIQGKGSSWGRKFIYGAPNTKKSPVLTIKYKMPSTTVSPTPTTVVQASPTQIPAPTNNVSSAPSPTTHDEHGGDSEAGTLSHAIGLWTPNPKYDTCTKEEHDSYRVQGPDGKWYPTWHPPIHTRTDGSTCTLGHEHGRNPSGSVMMQLIKETYGYDADKNGKVEGSELTTAGIPFGYVNEQLDIYNASKNIEASQGMRHEDHVGHKIEWENNLQRDWSTINGGSGRIPSGIYCDFFMKIHQGTHSKDAFTNNLHELVQAYKCTDGIQMANAQMLIFGKPGGFSDGSVAGGNQFVQVGSFTPPNAPGTNTGLSRAIPTIGRVLKHILVANTAWSQYSEGIYEDWISGNYVRTPNGTQIAYYDPHFAVFGPSRFYWPGDDTNTYGINRTAKDIADNVGRSIDVCYMKESNGEKYRGGECDTVTNYGKNTTPISYDDPRSPFNGVKREFYFNNMTVGNVGSTRIWYSDPFGNNATTTNFVGAVKHYLKPKDTPEAYQYPFESNAIGSGRYYGGQGVHAPN